MSQVRNASEDDFVLHIDIVAALNLIVGATQFRLLKHAPDREQDAERGDCLTELRPKVPRTPGRGRRRTPKSTSSTPIRSGRPTTSRKKAATSVKRSTQQVVDGDRTPSPPRKYARTFNRFQFCMLLSLSMIVAALVNSLVTPTARTRPVLTRSAKAAAVSKTRRWLFEKDED
ncbi:hypothetical protein TELCIR_02268 [Teladorsagia circumcincta]|uniref:Uncharacterized protein n=1 Tax=Teladorsagia circumcincta TaxID=45464 RepID=A0A2G9UZM7_TELCI|nr:hypothetical protein TELCIR_02268 [Teladorsagia circumcincta]